MIKFAQIIYLNINLDIDELKIFIKIIRIVLSHNDYRE